MWIEKIKNNKGQYVLFALIVFITIAVFSMSFSFVAEIGAYSKNLLNDENSSDFYMMTMHNQELEDSITDEDAFDNIESYDTYEGYQISVPMVFDDQNIAMLFQSALETDNNDDMSEFELVESKDGDKVPAKGEIWIPLILSDPLGINL